MEETSQHQSTTPPSGSTGPAGHRHHVGDKLMELEGRWFMGRFAPRELLDGIDQYLRLETPERRKELLDTIRTRAEQLQGHWRVQLTVFRKASCMSVIALCRASRRSGSYR